MYILSAREVGVVASFNDSKQKKFINNINIHNTTSQKNGPYYKRRRREEGKERGKEKGTREEVWNE